MNLEVHQRKCESIELIMAYLRSALPIWPYWQNATASIHEIQFNLFPISSLKMAFPLNSFSPGPIVPFHFVNNLFFIAFGDFVYCFSISIFFMKAVLADLKSSFYTFTLLIRKACLVVSIKVVKWNMYCLFTKGTSFVSTRNYFSVNF